MGANKSKYVCSKCNKACWVTDKTNLFSGSPCCGVKVISRDRPRELNRIAKARKDLEQFNETTISYGRSDSSNRG